MLRDCWSCPRNDCKSTTARNDDRLTIHFIDRSGGSNRKIRDFVVGGVTVREFQGLMYLALSLCLRMRSALENSSAVLILSAAEASSTCLANVSLARLRKMCSMQADDYAKSLDSFDKLGLEKSLIRIDRRYSSDANSRVEKVSAALTSLGTFILRW